MKNKPYIKIKKNNKLNIFLSLQNRTKTKNTIQKKISIFKIINNYKQEVINNKKKKI